MDAYESSGRLSATGRNRVSNASGAARRWEDGVWRLGLWRTLLVLSYGLSTALKSNW